MKNRPSDELADLLQMAEEIVSGQGESDSDSDPDILLVSTNHTGRQVPIRPPRPDEHQRVGRRADQTEAAPPVVGEDSPRGLPARGGGSDESDVVEFTRPADPAAPPAHRQPATPPPGPTWHQPQGGLASQYAHSPHPNQQPRTHMPPGPPAPHPVSPHVPHAAISPGQPAGTPPASTTHAAVASAASSSSRGREPTGDSANAAASSSSSRSARSSVPDQRATTDARHGAGSDGPQGGGSGRDDDGDDAESPDEAHRDFLAAWQAARAKLIAQQQPNLTQPDRRTARLVERLSQLTVQDAAKVVELIDQLGETGSVAAVDAIRVWAGRRQRTIQAACARALAQIDSPRSGLLLLDLATRDATDTHRPAIAGLLRWHARALLPSLLTMAAARKAWPAVMQNAAAELSESEQTVLQQRLQRLWRSSDPDVAALAIFLASRLPGGVSVDDLQRFTRHPSARVRAAVIEAMVFRGEKKAIRFVNSAMTDPEPEVRAQAGLGLQSLCSPRSVELLLAGAQDENLTVRRNCARALASCGKCSGSVESIAALINNEHDPVVLEALLEVLGGFDDPEVLQLLEGFLDHPSDELRRSAIRSLRRISSPAVAPIFLRQLDDRSDDVRRIALDGLGRIGSKDAVDAVIRVLQSDSSVDCRAAAAKALGRIRSRKSLPALESALTDSQQVQCQVVLAMGALRDRSAAPVLAALLKTASPEVRYHCCSALAELKAQECGPLIRPLLMDSDPMLQRGARQALEKLGLDTRGPGPLQRVVESFRRTLRSLPVPGSPDTGRLAAVAGGVLLLVALVVGGIWFNPFSGSGAITAPVVTIRDVAINSVGEKIGIVRKFGVVELWNAQTGELKQRIQSPELGLDRGLFCGEKLLLLSNNSFRVWDTSADPDGENISVLSDVQLNVSSVCLPRRSNQVFLVDPRGEVSVLEQGTMTISRKFQLPYSQTAITAVSADGSIIAVAERDGTIRRVSTEDGTVVEEFSLRGITDVEPEDYATGMAVSDDATLLAVALKSGPILVLDTVRKQLKGRLQEDARFSAKDLFYDVRNHLTVFSGLGSVETFDENLKPIRKASAGVRNPLRHEVSGDNLMHVYFEDESADFWVLNLAEDESARNITPE